MYESQVRHVRTARQRYTLAHRTCYWLVDVDDLPRPARPLRPLAQFRGGDHFDGRGHTIRAGLERFLSGQGAATPSGVVLMLTQPRVLGHVFNPLTVYWCHDADGALRHVVAEVHNTYGERHGYLLGPQAVRHATTGKAFYVSPFFPVAGRYRMRLPVPDGRLDLTVQLDLDGSRAFTATVKGTGRPYTPRALLAASLRHPLAPLAVSIAIRLHGIRLYLRGLPVVPRPRHQSQEGMK
ncbi:DUF1365 domain-containing protein [Streptacidiphilus fuscans]|uniref:DUF1365 domain-containing protein n=1 Tax=Streptacidiphilus fuscans TaxID=2789292 RepID=A0A931B3W9_9ACTN|nr:DUF1365 domain-containing protein [Streptacidiphilus fuscans]MBF9066450.1 DUF1365 domain-containing protein [Streptacidiphilus fuscans]